MPPTGPPPGGPGQPGGAPPGWPPQGVPPRKTSGKGKVIAVIAAVAVVVVLGGGVGLFLFLREDGPMTGREGVGLEVTTKVYGVDEVRTPSPPGPQTGNGGDYGEALLDALKTAGFQCSRLDGNGQSAQQICYRQEKEPTPTIQSVGISIIDNEVVRIRSNVDVDPAWTTILDHLDVRPTVHNTFQMLIEATIPDGQRPTASRVLAKAGEGEDKNDPEDSGHARADLSSGKVEINMGMSGGQFILERPVKEGTVFVDHGLDYVTPKELQAVAEDNGLQCNRKKDALTCSGGNGTEMAVEFPVPVSGTQFVSDVEVSTQGEPSSISGLAQQVARLVAGKYGQADQAQDWVTGCFSEHTDQTSYAHSEFGCEPGLEGTPEDPKVTGSWFYITRITGT